MLAWSLLLPLVNSCAPLLRPSRPSPSILDNFPVSMNSPMIFIPTTTTTTTPPAPENADYYDDISLHLTRIDERPTIGGMSLAAQPIVKGNMVVFKPPQPKPLILPAFRDMRPIPLEKSAKTFPLFFDFFRPAPLPTFPPIKNFIPYKLSDTPFGHASPPISWTYCEPLCGSGDQAVDAESALDNAQVDVKEGLAHAFGALHLPPPRDEQVDVRYKANSTILEEFGGKYDYSGYIYVTIGKAVAFRRHKEDSSKNGSFYVEVKVEIQHNSINTAVLNQVATKLMSFLQIEKGARIPEEIHISS